MGEAPAICPDCRHGKHKICAGWALDARDQEVDCQCPDDAHKSAT